MQLCSLCMWLSSLLEKQSDKQSYKVSLLLQAAFHMSCCAVTITAAGYKTACEQGTVRVQVFYCMGALR